MEIGIILQYMRLEDPVKRISGCKSNKGSRKIQYKVCGFTCNLTELGWKNKNFFYS